MQSLKKFGIEGLDKVCEGTVHERRYCSWNTVHELRYCSYNTVHEALFTEYCSEVLGTCAVQRLKRSKFGKLLQKYANSVSLVAVRDDYVL
jgi:hypothetical protein